jgi:hypothetical protein
MAPTVEHPVGLGAGRANGWPLARVERAELDARLVSGDCHRATQSIHLANEMPLPDPANGRIAGHLPQGLDRMRQQQRARARTRCRKGGLSAGMATAHHYDVEALGIVHGHR